MRKQLGQHRGQKAGVVTSFGANFVAYVGDIDDHVVTFHSRPKGYGDIRYVRVEHVLMLAPVDEEVAPLVTTQ
jgi:hypothetical protein